MSYVSDHELLPSLLPTFPPELLAIIASFIPLTQAPCTLRSLVLACRELRIAVLPLLYARLVLKNESGALAVFSQILEEPERGLDVKELYVMSSLSRATRRGENEFDAVIGIRSIIDRALLPNLSVLGIYLTRNWNADKQFVRGRLPTQFWKDLRNHCPQLRTIILRNVRDAEDRPFLYRTIVDDMGMFTVRPNLRHFALIAKGLLRNL